VPDVKDAMVLDNDILVPYGKVRETNIKNSSLLYNEFIVYDVKQVHIRVGFCFSSLFSAFLGSKNGFGR
jgi:hypothetical protein